MVQQGKNTGMQQKRPATMAEYIESLSRDVMKDLSKRKDSGLVLPANYVPQNALTAAIFKLKETVDRDKKPALSVCSADSVRQALSDMLVKGLDPAKTQCYFIVYGTKLTMFESYFGLIHRAKQADPNIKNVYSEIVYSKDKFAYSLSQGVKKITTHEQSPDNIDLQGIKGAYATIVYSDGTEVSEYMSWDQIVKSWSKSQTKGNSDTHKTFADQMAKRTVLKRLVKSVVNTADDSQLLADVDTIDEQQDEHEATEMIDITPPDPEPVQEPDPEPNTQTDDTFDDLDADMPDVLKG